MNSDQNGNLVEGPTGAILLSAEERTRCEVWTRVMGYHRPVAAWNAGKQQEHRDRVPFSEVAASSPEAQTLRRAKPTPARAPQVAPATHPFRDASAATGLLAQAA